MPIKLPERWLPFAEFDKFDWTPPDTILAPWLPVGGVGLIYGAGGVGKTYLSLACAMSIAEGRSRVPYMHVPKARRVLYVDGEMQPAQFKERFTKLERRGGFSSKHNFAILTHAAFRDGLPDLLIQDGLGQKLVWKAAQEHRADVIFLDNVSALVKSGDPNTEASMKPFLNWLMAFRRTGRSVVVVHHTGHTKPEDGPAHARGTSSFNDKLDAALWLKGERGKTPERIPSKLFYTKHRFFVPPEDGQLLSCCFDPADTECWFDQGGALPREEPEWVPEARRLREEEGQSNRQIAIKLGISHPTVGKYLGVITIGELQ